MIRTSTSYNIFKFSLFFYFLYSMLAWFAWYINIFLAWFFVSFAILEYYIICRPKICFTKKRSFILLIFFLLCIWNTKSGSIITLLSTIFNLGIAVFVFYLPVNIKVDIIQSITKWFARLLLISVIAYILFLFIKFPAFNIIKAPFGYHDYANYIIFIISSAGKFDEVYRFNSIFLEPGHLGMICSFLLFASKYNFRKKEVLIISLSLLLSLSLAGYVLFLLGYILFKSKNIIKILSFIFILTLAYFYVTELWNNGKNPINERIISRLEYDEDKGIVGNNRVTYITDILFNEYNKNGELLFGISSEKYEKHIANSEIEGAGYKLYVMKYGYVGVLLISFFYLYIAYDSKYRYYAYAFFLLLVASFIQRAYPLWLSWLLPYICGISNNDNNIATLKMKLKNKHLS